LFPPDGRQVQLGAHAVDRHVDIGRGAEHDAVEVDDGSADGVANMGS